MKYWEQEDNLNPYLKPSRLPDLMAAIQTMALFERYRRSAAKWADLISGDENKAAYWKAISDEHPEFFRPSITHPGDYALVWRRAGNPRYHRGLGRLLEKQEMDAMAPDEYQRYMSRPPVPETQIKTLLDTAINLHQKAVDAHRDRRWWITPMTAILSTTGSFIGAIIGARLRGLASGTTLSTPAASRPRIHAATIKTREATLPEARGGSALSGPQMVELSPKSSRNVPRASRGCHPARSAAARQLA